MIVSRFLLKTRLQVEKLTKENCDALGSAHERKVQFLKQSHSSVEIPIFYELNWKIRFGTWKFRRLYSVGLIHHNCLIGEFFPYCYPFACFLPFLFRQITLRFNTELYMVDNESERLCCNQRYSILQRFVVKQNQDHYTWRIFQQ